MTNPFDKFDGDKNPFDKFDENKPTNIGGAIKDAGSAALNTVKNISKAYPVAETAMNMATSSYGIPLSGIAGLLALPSGLSNANKVVNKVQDALIYKPQTKSGQELTESVSYPFSKIEQGADVVGDKIADAGYPNIAAGVHTAISGAPVIIGGKMALKKPTSKALVAVDNEMDLAITNGINKAVRPSSANKSTHSQVKQYLKNAKKAVKTIVENSDSVELIDKNGVARTGLPQTLDEFSQAISSNKKKVFEQYDALAKQSDAAITKRPIKYPLGKDEKVLFDKSGKGVAIGKPVKVDLNKIGSELDQLTNNKVLQKFSPETIQYINERTAFLSGDDFLTAVETQDAIQLLNQSQKAFYNDPTPKMYGRALVDSLIANNLRKQLDTVINKTTGKEYKSIKSEYGALKSIESDVVKRSIVDSRKNTKGLIDFSDIFTGHQAVSGILRLDPTSLASAGAAKGISKYYKLLNDPNRIVKKMFSDVERLQTKRNTLKQMPKPYRMKTKMNPDTNVPVDWEWGGDYDNL